MAYDETLAERIGNLAATEADITTRKMFGGIAFMWRGNMLCGVMGDDMMARVGRDQYEALLAEPGASRMDFTGRPMKGMITVSGPAVLEDADLAQWIARCQQFVASLPAK